MMSAEHVTFTGIIIQATILTALLGRCKLP